MLDEKQMKRLKEHSKQHKGGMGSKHMRMMKRLMEEGMSFTKAHNRAKKEHPPMEDKSMGKKKSDGLTPKQKKLPEGLKKAIMKSKSKVKNSPKNKSMY